MQPSQNDTPDRSGHAPTRLRTTLIVVAVIALVLAAGALHVAGVLPPGS